MNKKTLSLLEELMIIHVERGLSNDDLGGHKQAQRIRSQLLASPEAERSGLEEESNYGESATIKKCGNIGCDNYTTDTSVKRTPTCNCNPPEPASPAGRQEPVGFVNHPASGHIQEIDCTAGRCKPTENPTDSKDPHAICMAMQSNCLNYKCPMIKPKERWKPDTEFESLMENCITEYNKSKDSFAFKKRLLAIFETTINNL